MLGLLLAAKLLEGSVDACALLDQKAVSDALKTGQVTVAKGVLTQTWGSACRWSARDGDAFISVVAHTKHGAQTYNGLRRRLPSVRNRRDLGKQAYQSGTKIYLLERGAFITVEWSGAEEKVVDGLVRSLLKELDALAATQAVHK